jgi:protein O-GlcNAc transferase
LTIQQILDVAAGELAAGRLEEAIAAYGQAVRLDPLIAQIHNNLGVALKEAGRVDEAIGAFRRAIELLPDRSQAWNNLGTALAMKGDMDGAITAYREALAREPGNAQAHNNLGVALEDTGRADEALDCYDRALAIDPGFVAAHSNRVYAVHFHEGYSAAMILEEARRWNRCHAEALGRGVAPHENERSAERRLRVGYVSPDFCEHVVGRFMRPLLANHDHERFEVFCYSGVVRPDGMTRRLEACADVWRNIVGVSDERVAGMIRADRIDILVDLSMHMARNRLLVFARRPAPVQVTYLAYCSTTGMGAMNYRITDAHLDPLGEREGFYSERSVRLESYWCYEAGSDAEMGTLPASEAGVVTFGCLNNFRKVTTATLAVWGRLMRSLAGSRLILHAREGSHRERASELLAREGVDPGRIHFVGQMPLAEYFEVYRQIDIGLDPFPYGGGTTTCDALWMGVPVVTLRGETAVGRGGVSILSSVGLGELAAETVDEYVKIAGELANDRSRLSALRLSLRRRMLDSPLMNGKRFARGMERAYRSIWRKWCEE